MSLKYTEEQLNSLDRETLIRLFLSQQEQLENIDHTLQLVLEQMADLKRHRFGRSSEKHEAENQISFMEVDGKIVFFNEAEAVAAGENTQEEPENVSRRKPQKKQGKREEDLEGLPVVVVEHSMTDDELEDKFGKDGWKQLPDEVYRRYSFTPAKVEVEEHHVKVYAGKKTVEIVKAEHPECLLRGSLVSPSLEAAVMNAKYVNAVPLYRQEQEFERYGLHISRQNMANWTIQCADRYLAVLYDYLHEKLYSYHVLQADETPVLVNKDGRPAGSKSCMWVYRTGRMYTERQIVLYEYQKTRNASHPREFLKDFNGVCVTDGYQVYHTIEGEREDLRIAGCWSHARRRFDEAVKALPKQKQKDSRAYLALTMIQAIYREEKTLSDILHQQIAAGQETEQIRKEGEAIRQEVSELSVTNLLLREQTETLTEDKEKLLSKNEKLEKQQKKLQQELNKMVKSKEVMERNIHAYDEDVKWQLAEPGALMSAKAYRDKKALPLVEKLKEVVKNLTIKCIQLTEQSKKFAAKVDGQQKRISHLADKVMEQSDTIDRLQEKASDLGRLERHLGREQVQSIVERSKAIEQAERAKKRPKRTFEMSR